MKAQASLGEKFAAAGRSRGQYEHSGELRTEAKAWLLSGITGSKLLDENVGFHGVVFTAGEM